MRRASLSLAASIGWVIFSCAPIHSAQKDPDAATFPSRPIRIVIPFTPGGMPDITARMIAIRLTESLGQQVIVDNRAGAGGVVGSRIVAESTPDGHTLLATSASHVLAPSTRAQLPYDTVKDFAGITRTSTACYLLVVAPSLSVTTVKDLIALAKAKPGQLNFASAGAGSGTHFAGEMLKHHASIDVVHVPYKGIPEALTDIMAGRVQIFMAPLISAIPLARDGKVRALGVSAEKRVRAHPDIPTIAEAALPGFRFDSWSGMLAPARTPRAIVEKLNREVVRILLLPEFQLRLGALGAEPAPTTPAEFDKLIGDELVVAARLAQQAGIKPE
jgi:tripartite-type tricarboxylate transporter receptor subunit TctC